MLTGSDCFDSEEVPSTEKVWQRVRALGDPDLSYSDAEDS